MKGYNWKKHLAACMALAIVTCSSPLQAAAEQADEMELTAIALEEPTTESELAESTIPVDDEMQETEASSEAETPAEPDVEATPDEGAPVGESVQFDGEMLLAAASAADGVSYISRSWDETSKQIVETQEMYTGRYIKLTNNSLTGAQNEEGTWYYADTSLTFSKRGKVTGTVNLVLGDGVTITFDDGITVGTDATLNIYGQSAGTGTLKANADTNYLAAIGGEEGSKNNDKGDGGTIRVYGGHVEADCYSWGADAAGIGGGYYGDGGLFEMYGGTVEAWGGCWSHYGGAGIGGGYGGEGGETRIYGGTVTAIGGASAAGIGGGDSGAGGEITIKGGTVNAIGREGTSGGGAGIGGGNEGRGGIVKITGGDVNATGGGDGAGIGGGNNGYGGKVYISDGKVTANGAYCAAGIGGGYNSDKKMINGEYVEISGGEVHATGGDYAAGIGGGCYGNGGTVIFSGGTIEATGGKNAAAVGTAYDPISTDAAVQFKGAAVTLNSPSQPISAAKISFDDPTENECYHVTYDNGKKTAAYAKRVDTCRQSGIGTLNVAIVQTTYAPYEWVWSEDLSSATAKFKCTKCGGNPITQDAVVTSCNDNDLQLSYTAKIELNGKTYIDEKIETLQKITYQTSGYDMSEAKTTYGSATTDDYIIVKDYRNSWSDSTYFVNSDVTISDKITVSGNVNLVLRDGATLTANSGIEVAQGGTLHIYSQSEGMGKLIVSTAGVGTSAVTGSVTIYGGTIEAKGGKGADGKLLDARIALQQGTTYNRVSYDGFTGGAAFSGEITIYNGNIKAVGGDGGKGVKEEGYYVGLDGKNGAGFAGNVTIYGGIFAETDNDLIDVSANANIYNGTFLSRPDSAALAANHTIVYDDGRYLIERRMDTNAVKSGETIYYTVNNIPYITAEYNTQSNTTTYGNATAKNGIVVEGKTTQWSAGTYVVDTELNVNDRIKVSGNVNLILCDGAVLTANRGIEVAKGGTLNIYAQSEGTGKLIVHSINGDRFLKTDGLPAITGDVMIYGGVVEAKGGTGRPGYDWDAFVGVMVEGQNGMDGLSAFSGNIIVYNGNIKAIGGDGGKGGLGDIDGEPGNSGAGFAGNVTIYGGTFEDTGREIMDGAAIVKIFGGDFPFRPNSTMLAENHKAVAVDDRYLVEWKPDRTVHDIPYQTADYNMQTHTMTYGNETAKSAYVVEEDSTRWSTGTYVVDTELNITEKIRVSGNVNLILCDGALLFAKNGIKVAEGGMLNVYAQSEGTGKLIVSVTDLANPAVSGSVTIYGGIIEAKGGTGVQGLGAPGWARGLDGNPGAPAFLGDTVIFDGMIKAIGGNGGPGGKGYVRGSVGKNGASFSGNVTIYSGSFEKTDCELFDGSSNAAIYGGTFASEPNRKHLAAGFAVTNTDGKYVVGYNPSAVPSRGDSGEDGEDYTATVTRKDSENPPAFTINAAPVSLSDIFDVTLTDADDEPLEPVWEAKETEGIQIGNDNKVSFTAPGTYHIRVHDADEIVYSEWQEIVVESGSVTPEDKEPIADETLIQWVKVDYEKRYSTAVYPEIESKSTGAYEIYVKNKDNEVLDIYTVDPRTGIGESRINPEINLPQTGIDARGTAAAVGGALALTAAGFWLLRRSSRRKQVSVK